MDKIKKYQKQIATFIVIFLLFEFGIFPSLTAANTLLNILGSIGLLLLVVWAVLALYDWAKYTEIDDDLDLKEESEESDDVNSKTE
jgi:protein-S-isoprenylcysteine O-methyltransferase Ste14